ncbi:hypothetical protein AGMMS49928_12330 [Spirochaetia bacterium]|nr:hypothetical protein AGMMS49928_12330 [Spirochaetia bacterium]
MKKTAWKNFTEARDRFKSLTEDLSRNYPGLQAAQQKLVDSRGGPAYPVETPVVYNNALDDIRPETNISLILVADNPGRREQAAENRRYLVGPSGKIAEKFFREHPGLEINFRQNVIIINKTPIHTPRTVELWELCRPGTQADFSAAIVSSQQTMAEILLDLHRCLAPIPVWITGYSEMKKGGIFEAYTEALKKLYKRQRARREEVFLFRHFSMNQFTIDLNQQKKPAEPLETALKRIGAAYRMRILGW